MSDPIFTAQDIDDLIDFMHKDIGTRQPEHVQQLVYDRVRSALGGLVGKPFCKTQLLAIGSRAILAAVAEITDEGLAQSTPT